MKRILTILSLVLLLTLATVLGAQKRHNGNGHYNPPNQYQNNHNYHNGLREFRGFLIVNEKEIRHNARLGFHINLSPLHINHIDFTAGQRLKNRYGIIVKKPGGGYTYYRLDKKGRKIARKMFARERSNRDQIYVEVKGKLNHNSRTISVKSIARIRNNHRRNPGWDDHDSHHWG